MVLWITALVMLIIFLLLLFLIWIRKIQFDAIHNNFLDLEDEFGGRVIRAGFASRPSYSGEFKGETVTISISTEKNEGERRYYIAITMQAKSKTNFTIMSAAWLNKPDIGAEGKRTTKAIRNGEYILETSKPEQLNLFDIPVIEKIIAGVPPFAYILMAKSGMILESISQRIVDDTKLDALLPLLEGMYELKQAVE